ncbi:ABC transporter ATP-binding protein [Peptoniphilus sp.]|jgi:ATP-binding cassette subfamily B protein|uniref:ABC transporter ATP-binding protein n=1 Tax=Peptoniphilus sp. TaxID=1971214 RepID=UPI003D8D93F2
MIKRIYKEVSEMSKEYLYFSVFIIIIKSIYPIILVLFPKIIIESITSGISYKSIIPIISIILIKFVSTSVIKILENKLLFIGTELNQKFETKILKKLMTVDYETLENPQILDMKDEALEGISISEGSSISIYNEKFIEIISSIISIVGVAYIITKISAIYLIVLIIILTLDFVIEKIIADFEMKNWSKWIPINRQFRMVYDLMYNFKNGPDIRMFSAEDFFTRKVNSANKNMYEVMSDEARTVSRYGIFTAILESLKIFVIGYLAIDGLFKKILSIADFGAYLVAVNVFIDSVKSITHAVVDINKLSRYMKSYFTFLDLDTSKKKIEERTVLNKDDKVSKIEFKNVYFKYPSMDEYTLLDINFKIEENEKISLVGLNGAGKSTIIKLLTGLYKPTKGEILIDGVSTVNYNKDDLFKKFAAVFQDFNIFPLSVAENISMNGARDESKIEELLYKTDLLKRVKSLEYGLDENLYRAYDSSSTDLSMGQKQKIALARALYSDREFLLLDEPTASVDVYTELNFYKNLEQFAKDKTSIFISHRLISSKFCDRIIVLENGKIIESGSFEDLLKEDSRFKEMFQMQREKFI